MHANFQAYSFTGMGGEGGGGGDGQTREVTHIPMSYYEISSSTRREGLFKQEI